ncbi:MAG: hypothetical protein ICV78_02120 [Tolypothrix sp. Co-bin9]|nr:hypothetical protein [Tolypothrix sp. Co-bin9]
MRLPVCIWLQARAPKSFVLFFPYSFISDTGQASQMKRKMIYCSGNYAIAYDARSPYSRNLLMR